MSVVLARRSRGCDPLAGAPAEAVDEFLSAAGLVLKRDLLQPLVSGYASCRYEAINEIVDEAHEMTSIGLGRRALIRFARRTMLEDECHADEALAYLSEPRAPAAERLTLLEEMLTSGRRRFAPLADLPVVSLSDLLEANALPLVLCDGRFEPTDGPVMAETVNDPF